MGPADVLLYLPFPYWVGSVLAMYRHGLSRLSHPVRDNGSLRNWWYVLGYLGLLGPEATSRPSVKKEVLPYVAYSVASAAVSLSWVLRLFPLHWYYLVLIQAISGLILTAATMQFLGSPPRRPYVDVLRSPRLGSRIRHLRKMSSLEVEHHPEQRPASPAGDGTLPTPSADTKDQGGAK
jgi:hypothetical protein